MDGVYLTYKSRYTRTAPGKVSSHYTKAVTAKRLPSTTNSDTDSGEDVSWIYLQVAPLGWIF